MKITSVEIKEHEFDRSFRGYNVDEVNGFLDDLGREWDKMLNEIQLLKMQLEVSEKNLAKFQGLEATLLNTLKSSEETSKQKIVEAEGEAAVIINDSIKKADKTISEAEVKAIERIEDAQTNANRIVDEANLSAEKIILEAENKANLSKKEAQAEIDLLSKKYHELESKRNAIIDQLKNYNLNLTNIINSPDLAVSPSPKVVETSLEPETVTEEKVEEESIPEEVIAETEEVVNIPSVANKLTVEEESEDKTKLEIIEGIGPRIKEILNNAGIKDFRTLAITPEYKLKEILAAAGPQFNMHDPGTWNEQALLAENGKWEELKELQDKLIGGRPEEQPEPPVETDGKDTDDMLEKVNKVKAAIRKAMSEKPQESPAQDKPKGESFFDSL